MVKEIKKLIIKDLWECFSGGLMDTHYVRTERESGYGKFDIYLEPRKKEKNGFVIEIKLIIDAIAKEEMQKTKRKKGKKRVIEIEKIERLEEKMKKVSLEALEQIKVEKYYTELLSRDIASITIIGIIFCGKRAEVSWEKIKK